MYVYIYIYIYIYIYRGKGVTKLKRMYVHVCMHAYISIYLSMYSSIISVSGKRGHELETRLCSVSCLSQARSTDLSAVDSQRCQSGNFG